MCRYKHLTLEDREGIMVMYIDGKSIADIADAIDRDKSTVSREVRRSAQGAIIEAVRLSRLESAI